MADAHMKHVLFSFVLWLLVHQTAEAHGVWTAHRGGALAVVFGEGTEEESYDPARVSQIQTWMPAGEPVAWRSETRSGQLFIHAPRAARLTFQLDAGEWTETRRGEWLPGGRGSAVPDAKQSWHLLRFANVLLSPPGERAIQSGMALEIQALADPFQLDKGQTLPVRVLLRGEPLAGAKVIADFINGEHAAPIITDRHGVARITLGGSGLNVLQTAYSEACPEQACAVDRSGYSATLSFTLPRSGN
jgi:nickel transport protein